MKIQEEYDLNIYIDKLNIFETKGVILIDGEITESIGNPVPECRLSLSVPIGWLDERSIVDGTLIEYEIKDKRLNIQERLKFRLFNIKKIEINQRFAQVDMQGLLDFYDGYSHSNEFNMYANSSDVFKRIANAFRLESNIDDTNDAQLWVAGENNLYQFMMNMATYGWVDETSAMFWCMDRHKILLYKNFTSLLRKRSSHIGQFLQQIYTDPSEKIYGYSKANGAIMAGSENILNGGYGGEDHYFDLLNYNWQEVTAKKVVAESNLINISKDLSHGLAQTFYPFDIGNFHKNYYKAKKQNTRILATYSTYVNVAATYFMPYRLGQIVNFQFTDAQDLDNKVKSMSGVFSICAIKIKLSMKAITCNLQLVMQGLNGQAITRETY